MYKKGTGNDNQGKDLGKRTLCPYRKFSQAIIWFITLVMFLFFSQTAMIPGPPFVFGAGLVLLAILVALFIPESSNLFRGSSHSPSRKDRQFRLSSSEYDSVTDSYYPQSGQEHVHLLRDDEEEKGSNTS